MNYRKLIEHYAQNEDTIHRGHAYYMNHFVHGLTITDINDARSDFPNFVARATVQSSVGLDYEVSVIIRNNDALAMKCTCPAYDLRGGFCKHLVALMYAIEAERMGMVQTIRRPPSLRLAAQLLDQYRPALPKGDEDLSTGLAHLEPKVFFDSSAPAFKLEFSLGIGKMYVLKSLHQFADRLLQQDIFRYGKDLLLLHERKNFTAESQFYLDLILETNRLLDTVVEKSNYYISKGSVLGRQLTLTPNQFDAFFDHVCGQTLPLSTKELFFDDYRFLQQDPSVQFAFERRENDLYQLLCDLDHYWLYQSDHWGYFLYDKTLYRTSETFCRYAFPLLASLKNNQRSGIMFDRGQLSAFIGLVYPHLTHVGIEPTLLEELTPAALEARLYFDYPYAEAVRGRAEFVYGSVTIDPLVKRDEDASVPYRDTAKEYAILSLLQKYRFSVNEDEYMLLGEESIYDFLTQGLTELLPLAQIMVEDKLEKMKSKKPFQLAMEITMTKGIIEIKFDESKFSHAELMEIIQAYQKGKKYIILKDNTFLDIVNPSAKMLDELLTDFDLSAKDLGKSSLKVPAYRALYLNDLLEQAPEVTAEKSRPYKNMVRDILEPIDTDFTVPANLHAQLRQYQLVGYRWLKTLAHYGFGGILADDMGLGKTVQAIALLLSELENATRPSIIVAPTSLIYNWRAELDKFAPDISYRLIVGSAAERQALLASPAPGELLITSYDALKRDIDYYSELEFEYCIADEAQYIKNHYTQNAQAVKALASRVRFALTGTPMENSLADLWSIMDFVMPGYLLRWQKFKAIYEIPITRYEDRDRLQRLRRQVAPFLLRRVKKDVLKELPDKIETTLYAKLSEEEQKIYHAQLAQSQKEFLDEIAANGIDRSQIKILALLTRLRQACCSPSLFLDNYHQTSSKLAVCLDLIEEKMEAGSQMIIFSQFTSMLDLIAAELRGRQIPYLMLTGSTKSEARMTMVNRFNNDHIPIFLISLKAGGVGLNLVAADTVIHFDPWWNLSAQNQATDRAHRIGQDKKVHVIKLIAKDTIEEKIEILQNKKKDLTDAVITQGQTFLNKLDKSELEELFSLQDYRD